MSDESVSKANEGAIPRGFSPGKYPADLECLLSTREMTALRLRPIRPDDNEKLSCFHSKLSQDSIYRRYFSLHPRLSPLELAHLTQVDYVDRLALVIESGDEIVAVSRYDRYPDSDEAEVAFIVADEFQHHGLGLLLLYHLADAAWVRGITTFLAETLATNREMLSVFLTSGYPVTTRYQDQEIMVRLSIEPTDAVRQHRELKGIFEGGSTC